MATVVIDLIITPAVSAIAECLVSVSPSGAPPFYFLLSVAHNKRSAIEIVFPSVNMCVCDARKLCE